MAKEITLKMYTVNIKVEDVQASGEKDAINETISWLKRNPQYGQFSVEKQD